MCKRNTGNYSTEEACLACCRKPISGTRIQFIKAGIWQPETGNQVNEKLVTKEKVSNLPIYQLVQLHHHAAIIIRFQRGGRIYFIHLDLFEYLAGKVKQRSTHDGVVLGLKLMAIFEDEDCRWCFV